MFFPSGVNCLIIKIMQNPLIKTKKYWWLNSLSKTSVLLNSSSRYEFCKFPHTWWWVNVFFQAAKTEEQLSQQLQSLREQFQLRRVALHEHIQQLEGLREEVRVENKCWWVYLIKIRWRFYWFFKIHLLTEKKVDLERRISALTEERDNLTENLDETSCRAMMLERQSKDTEHQVIFSCQTIHCLCLKDSFSWITLVSLF